jgi:Transglutaminase-like superfamily/Domain of unknown function (DUF4407)
MYKNFNIDGANTEALSHLSVNARRPLWVATIAIIITTLFAGYTGYEFVHTFSDNKYLPFVGGIIWASIIFAFDYSIYITPNSSLMQKLLRFVFGMSSNILGATLLLVSINQAEINNRLSLFDVNSVSQIDSVYNAEKDLRYITVHASIREEAEYHEQLCKVESHRNGAGPIYDRLHANCLAMQAARVPIKTQLDSNEVPFIRTWQINREAYSSMKHNDYFSKLNVGINIVKEDRTKIGLSVLLLLIALILEFWPLAVSASKDKNHIYYQASIALQANEDKAVLVGIAEAEKAKEVMRQSTYGQNLFAAQVQLNQFKEKLNLYALLEDGKAQIDESNGDIASAALHRQNATNYRALANRSTTLTSSTNADLFSCTKPMIRVIENIRAQSANTSELINNVYDWCHNNISYPEAPRLESCYDAKTCFNARSGVCSESAMLVIAFCRQLGLTANFYEVIVDMKGDANVNHAVAGVLNEQGALQLVDVAQHSANAKHKEVNLINDHDLIEKFKSWNQ